MCKSRSAVAGFSVTAKTLPCLIPSYRRHIMKRLIRTLFLLPWLIMGNAACADAAKDACAVPASARVHLLAVVGARDPVTLDNHVSRVHEESTRLDSILARMSHARKD